MTTIPWIDTLTLLSSIPIYYDYKSDHYIRSFDFEYNIDNKDKIDETIPYISKNIDLISKEAKKFIKSFEQDPVKYNCINTIINIYYNHYIGNKTNLYTCTVEYILYKINPNDIKYNNETINEKKSESSNNDGNDTIDCLQNKISSLYL
jgi:hypothetical protein